MRPTERYDLKTCIFFTTTKNRLSSLLGIHNICLSKIINHTHIEKKTSYSHTCAECVKMFSYQMRATQTTLRMKIICNLSKCERANISLIIITKKKTLSTQRKYNKLNQIKILYQIRIKFLSLRFTKHKAQEMALGVENAFIQSRICGGGGGGGKNIFAIPFIRFCAKVY